MLINTIIGVLTCLVCLLAVTSFIVLTKVHALHERCITILVVAYDWLEKACVKEEQEVAGRDGTD